MFSEKELDELRAKVKARMSEKRFLHTLGVEKMAMKLGEYCLPEKKQALRAAALLHDIAKEFSHAEMLDLIKKGGIRLSPEELAAQPTLHSFASVYLIKRDFQKFATKDILSACKNHTVGSSRMTVFDEIIFVSDFIEEGRAYRDSVNLRERVFSSLSGKRRCDVKLLHFAVAESIDLTLSHLKASGKYINPKTVLTKNVFLSKI